MKSKSNLSLLLIALILSAPLSSFLTLNAFAQIVEYQPEADSPYVRPILEDKTMTWKVINSSGVYKNENTQPGDLIRYEVDSVGTESYTIEAEKKSWSQNNFIEEDYTEPTYYLVKRKWGEIAVDYFITEDSSFWGGGLRVLQNYKVEYFTEWVNGFLINTIQISLIMNETNYDIIKYTREEGIMISRKAVVNAQNGTIRGYLRIDLESYSGFLISSPWYYVIIIVMIVAIAATVILVISSLIKRRKRMWREIEEI